MTNTTVVRTDKKLSAHAGLITVIKLIKATQLRSVIDSSLPVSALSTAKSYKKFSDLLLGLITGADCLDDMGKLACDQGFLGFSDEKVYTPKAYGDFLRSFSKHQISSLQQALMRQSFAMRQALFADDLQFIFDMDSTSNRQYGKKMEGVERNYKHFDSLDTLDVFDDKGFQYFINVRPGSSHTAQGSEVVVHTLMTLWQEYKKRSGRQWHACFRADSGYYSSGFINACVAKNADVIIATRQDEHHFPRIVAQTHNWTPTNLEDPDRLKFYDGREVEIGSTNYRPNHYQRRLRYVVMRARRPATPMFPDHVDYDYFAFATTYSEQLMSDENVILVYRKRGQAENYIKENKYGLDMKHYPCQKLDANRAYALICAFAYNYMRLMSLTNDKDKPVLSKNIRFRWINLPCLVARTGRNMILKFMDHHHKEITRWFELIHHLRFEFI